MSEPAISLDDAGYQNLRVIADRWLETTRVEYVLVVEVTSPTSPDTVLSDRTTKPIQSLSQRPGFRCICWWTEVGRWTLFGLVKGWERYQVAADGAYGQAINLPAPLNFTLATDPPRLKLLTWWAQLGSNQ